MTEHRVVVERHLRVERVHPTVRGEDQRVDLGEVRVALGVAAVELQEDVDRAVDRLRVELRGFDPLPALGFGQPVDRVDPDLADRVRVLLGDDFDLDAALRGEHPEVLLRGAVEREARVVLLVDVAGLLDPEDVDDVALDVEADDVGRVLAGFRLVRRELHAAGLAAPTDLHLRLQHHRVADAVRDRHRGLDIRDRVAVGDRDVVLREQLLALIFEQVHRHLVEA